VFFFGAFVCARAGVAQTPKTIKTINTAQVRFISGTHGILYLRNHKIKTVHAQIIRANSRSGRSLKFERQTIRQNPALPCRLRTKKLARIVRFHRAGMLPTFHDQIDARPKRTIAVGTVGEMMKQAHPESGDCFMIDVDAVPGGELQQHCAHARARIGKWKHGKVTQRGRHVRRVIELRWRYRASFKSVDQFLHIGIADEVARLQHSAICAVVAAVPAAYLFDYAGDTPASTPDGAGTK
jgi:hypothetical protein